LADIPALIAKNSQRWKDCKLTRGPEFGQVAKRLIAARARYQGISDKTGVPWFVIAVIHEREAGQDFMCSIAQGDQWNRRSIHEPKGRGPFGSFEEAAYDALNDCPPYAAKWKDWSAGGTLTLLEQYNGLGYANAGRPSPYIWSGTDQYTIGKITKDHGPIEPIVDRQLGCAGLLVAMGVAFGEVVIPPPPDVPPVEPQAPVNIWVALFKFILSLFKKGN